MTRARETTRTPRRAETLVQAAVRTPGAPLDRATRTDMELRLGHAFADVRVHRDAGAAAAAAALGADAFTLGRDIVFAAGRYRPDTNAGRRLLAHELVHAVQQGGEAPAAPQPFRAGAPALRTDPLEREAQSAADRVVAGDRVPLGAITVGAPAARGRVALQPATAAPAAADVVLGEEVPDSPDAVLEVSEEIEEALVFDPEDALGRVRRRLARLAPLTRRTLLDRLAGRVPAAALATVRALEAELAPPGVEEEAQAPAELEQEEDAARRAAVERAAEAAGEPVADEVVAAGGETVGPEEEAAEGEVVVPELAPPVVGEAVPEAPEPEAERAPAAATTEPSGTAAAVTAAVGTDAAAGPVREEDAEAAAPDEEAEDAGPVAEEDAPLETGEVAFPATPEGDVPPEVESPEDAEADTQAAPAVLDSAGEGAPSETAAFEPEVGDEQEAESTAAPVDAAAEGAEAPIALEELGAVEAEPAEEAPGGVPEPGGAAPIEEPPEPVAPDVTGMDSEAAVAAVAGLPPHRQEAALAGVSAGASRSVAEQRQELSASPPQLERPSGAPSAAERAAEALATPAPAPPPSRLPRAPERPEPASAPLPALPPVPAPATQGVAPPVVPGGPQGELERDGSRIVTESLRRLPTRDPALELRGGPPPRVALAGNADPGRVGEQRAELDTATGRAAAEGRRDVAEPAGEAALYPEVPPETLTAELPSPAALAPAPAAPARAAEREEDVAASVIAREQRGEALRGAVATAQTQMATRRTEQRTADAGERTRAQEAVTGLVSGNAASQTTERRAAREEVTRRRTEWSEAQRGLVDGARVDTERATTDAAGTIERERQQGERDARGEIETGDREADRHRRDAEGKAEKERAKGTEEAGGVISWLASKAEALFDRIKRGIQAVFEAARMAVRSAIKHAQELASAAIDRARGLIVGAIRLAGDALVAIGDRVLAGFPGLRDRFRGFIEDRVAKAERTVNALADTLKRGVQQALNLLGAALDAALGLLERGLLAAVAVYAAAVKGALDAARALAQALAAFAALVRDVAANPQAWLRNLGAAVVDGIRNHLWRAFKQAIQEWFNQKLDEVLGLGLTVWKLLTKGGIALGAIGRMVWEGLKQIIPTTLIQILVEKLVAMIVPVAGAIMVIIEGLRAAWGTVSRILQAFERFFAFLKAVKTGKAGPQFAAAVAAAAIAVIDFVANWLLMRLRKPAGKLAGKIREIAKRIAKKLGGLAKAFKQGLGKLFKRRGGRGRRRGRKPPDRAKQERALEQATVRLRQALRIPLPEAAFRLVLKGLKAWYKFRRLRVIDSGESDFEVQAGFSPGRRLVAGKRHAPKRAQARPIPHYWDPKINHVARGGLKGVVQLPRKAWRALEDKGTMTSGQVTIHGHHAWPVEELDGEPDQPLVGIRGALHNQYLHRSLDAFMRIALSLQPYTFREVRRRVRRGEYGLYGKIEQRLYSWYAANLPGVKRSIWERGIEYTKIRVQRRLAQIRAGGREEG